MLSTVSDVEVLQGGVANAGAGWPHREVWTIGIVFVRPSARRTGVGRELVEQISRLAAQADRSRLQTTVHSENSTARAFAVRLGFTLTNVDAEDGRVVLERVSLG